MCLNVENRDITMVHMRYNKDALFAIIAWFIIAHMQYVSIHINVCNTQHGQYKYQPKNM